MPATAPTSAPTSAPGGTTGTDGTQIQQSGSTQTQQPGDTQNRQAATAPPHQQPDNTQINAPTGAPAGAPAPTTVAPSAVSTQIRRTDGIELQQPGNKNPIEPSDAQSERPANWRDQASLPVARGMAPLPVAGTIPAETVTVFDLLTGSSYQFAVIADSPPLQGASLPRPRLPQTTTLVGGA